MTALRKYERLESPGLWRLTPEVQRREVVVGFREATLVLSDPKTEMALSHWSLPAVERLNPGQMPALFSPGSDATETLEIEDPDMVAALDAVRQALIRRRPRPGRLRSVLTAGSLVLLAGLGVFWLPDAMIRHTASVLPEATRLQIGRLALKDVMRLSGSPCAAPLGRRSAARLAARLAPEGVTEIEILREGLTDSAVLPGGIVLLGRSVVETPPDAETAAGFALAEATGAQAADPMIPLLHHAGLMATFSLLTTGEMDGAALAGFAETLLKAAQPAVAPEILLAQFRKAGVSPAAYAHAVDPTGKTMPLLIEADPFKDGLSQEVLPDRDWVSLQGICTE